MPARRFPPPWSVDEADSKLDRRCFIVRDANGSARLRLFRGGARPSLGGTSTDAR